MSNDPRDQVFNNPKLLEHVMGFVGLGYHARIAPVCHLFRDAYINYCTDPLFFEDDNDGRYKGPSWVKSTAVASNLMWHGGMVNIREATEMVEAGFPCTGIDWTGAENEFMLGQIAARNGLLSTLQRLHNAGCPIGTRTCSSAAFGNQLEVLQWLHQQGCPWNESTSNNAILHGCPALIEFVFGNGCPASPQDLHFYNGEMDETSSEEEGSFYDSDEFHFDIEEDPCNYIDLDEFDLS